MNTQNNLTELNKDQKNTSVLSDNLNINSNINSLKTNWQKEVADRKKKAKIFLYINMVIFGVTLVSLMFLFYFIAHQKGITTKKSTQNLVIQSPKSMPNNYITRKIDGVLVSPEKANNFLFAIMIDNHYDARPPSGLAQAHLVFEAEVEGGITRIMGIFSSDQNITEIGPVRSARPYFVDWARELSALYTHVGGSPDALVKIKQDKIFDINEFFNGKYFWRDHTRSRPHNVYTSIVNLDKYLNDKNADHNRFIPWTFKDDVDPINRPASSSLAINYRLQTHRVEWQYDRDNNNYQRYMAGEPHQDRSGNIITAKNIAVQVAEAFELDEKLRLEMNNIGNGKSLICMDGKCQTGTWQKKHPSDRTRFYAEDGREVKFNRGMTWVQVVRPEVEYLFN